MRVTYNKIDGTFLIGVTFGNYYNKKTDNKNTSLIFDLGKHSLAIIFRGEN